MFKNKKFSLIAIGALVLTLAIGLVAFAPLDSASAAGTDDDGFNHRRQPGGRPLGGRQPGRAGDGEALAEELGISLEELQAAHETAQTAAIEQALDEDSITQEQAERLQNGNFRAFGILVGPDSPIDRDAHLADALGISVEDLTEAREAVKDATIEQALEDGKITEEQISMMEARQALQDYITKDELTAEALGITVDELESAKEDGTKIPDLLEELGLSMKEFQANLQALHEESLAQAVEDGLITQEQADLLQEKEPGQRPSPGKRGWRPGGKGSESFRGRPGPGGTNFQQPGQPTNEG